MSNGPTRATTPAATGSSDETRFLPGYEPIHSPRWNYQRNIDTHYYRMSQLSFGSLLVAYLLGYITYAFAYFITTQPSPQSPIFLHDFLTHESLHFWQRIITSATFTTYTALLYTNFHTNLVYLSLDLKHAYWDFVIALSTGLFFGLSMLFPLTQLFWLSVLGLFSIYRLTTALNDYSEQVCRRVAKKAKWTIPGPSPLENKWTREMLRLVRPILRDELQETKDRILESWSKPFQKSSLYAMILLFVVPLAIFLLELSEFGPSELHQDFEKTLFAIHFVATTLVMLYLFWLLRRTGADLPGELDIKDGILDHRLIKALNKATKQVKAIPQYKRPGFRPPS